MADRDKGFSPPTTGGASLLTVFAVLCLTIFALLSLSTVRAHSALSDASAGAVENYYAADARAQEILARLRTGEETTEGVELTATIVDYPDHDEEIHSYAIPISDTQELRVEVRIDTPDDYEVLRWQVVNTGEWNSDGGLEIWDGDQPF